MKRREVIALLDPDRKRVLYKWCFGTRIKRKMIGVQIGHDGEVPWPIELKKLIPRLSGQRLEPQGQLAAPPCSSEHIRSSTPTSAPHCAMKSKILWDSMSQWSSTMYVERLLKGARVNRLQGLVYWGEVSGRRLPRRRARGCRVADAEFAQLLSRIRAAERFSSQASTDGAGSGNRATKLTVAPALVSR